MYAARGRTPPGLENSELPMCRTAQDASPQRTWHAAGPLGPAGLFLCTRSPATPSTATPATAAGAEHVQSQPPDAPVRAVPSADVARTAHSADAGLWCALSPPLCPMCTALNPNPRSHHVVQQQTVRQRIWVRIFCIISPIYRDLNVDCGLLVRKCI